MWEAKSAGRKQVTYLGEEVAIKGRCPGSYVHVRDEMPKWETKPVTCFC